MYNGKATFTPDGIDEKKKLVYEFYGCKYHGCQRCHAHAKPKFNSTMERENILKASGYSIVSMWECDWKEFKKTEMTKLEKKEL